MPGILGSFGFPVWVSGVSRPGERPPLSDRGIEELAVVQKTTPEVIRAAMRHDETHGDGNGTSVSDLHLMVTHLVKRARQALWSACPFITKEVGKNSSTYYFGFETVRPIDESVIDGEERAGSILKLAKAVPINQDQCLWLTETGDVWLALYDNPLGDLNKVLVAQNVG